MLVEYHSRLPGLSLRHILRHVKLSFEQQAKLCGVSRRQLAYWIRTGVVPAPGEDAFLTIERATLISIRLQRGDSLRQAVEMVNGLYERHRETLAELEGMSDEERGRQLAQQLEELQSEVNRIRQRVSEPSTPALDPLALMGLLKNLSLNELLSALPSNPTPELIIRLRQSIGHLRAAQRDQRLGNSHESGFP